MSYFDFRRPLFVRAGRRAGGLRSFALGLLFVEFLDELIFGVREVSWPLVRSDLHLSYVQIGLLLSLPNIIGNMVEPLIGILGDVWNRRTLVLGGGIAFTGAVLLVSLSDNFATLLVAFIIFSPASGAFVGLSQAALMDANPARREHNMARWTLAGSIGNAAGALALAAAVGIGASWRGLYAVMAGLSLLLLVNAWRFPFTASLGDLLRREGEASFMAGVRAATCALRRREVWRWLTLLEFADLTWDVLRGFLALYFVDVVGVSEGRAALAVIVWTVFGLPGDFLLIPLLERVRGLDYLRWSALAVLLLFPAFLLASNVQAKLIILAMLGVANAGWYSILKAQLYSTMPGQSGIVMALGNVSGMAVSIIPLGLGAVAEHFGLETMMWLLLCGPLIVRLGLIGVSRSAS